MRTHSALTLLCAVVAGCGAGPQETVAGPTFHDVMATRPRVLWVAAHPDDEAMGGGVLGKLCLKARSRCHFVVFNRGGGGECLLEQGCAPDLGTLRNRELVKAARLYHATLEHYDFFNAPLPVESFPTRVELERRWATEGDPSGLVARAIRRFRADVVVTLDPHQGFTGHPEHQAAARFALAGARRAADASDPSALLAGEPPHRVRLAYHVLNKYWFMALVGDPNDPKPYTETLDSTEACDVDRDGRDRSCIEAIKAHTVVHETQASDMFAIRSAAKFWGTAYVRRIDPFGAEAAAVIAELPASPR